MRLLREVDSGGLDPAIPDGWSVGTLGNQGILLSCDGFSIKFDIDQLNKFFDLIEDGRTGDIKDHDGNAVNVNPVHNGVILTRKNDETFKNGLFVDLDTLKHLGVELSTEVVGQNPSVDPDYSAETEAYPEQTYPDDSSQGKDNNVTIKKVSEAQSKVKKFKVTSIFRTEKKPPKKKIVRILRSKKIVVKDRKD